VFGEVTGVMFVRCLGCLPSLVRDGVLTMIHRDVFDLRLLNGERLVRTGSGFLGLCGSLIVVVLGAPPVDIRVVV
jgi:hypothetical protein